MALKFNILNQENARTLARGFGLPIIKRAIFEASVAKELLQQSNDVDFAIDAPEGTTKLGTPIYGSVLIQEPKFSTFKYNTTTKKYDKIDFVFSPSNKQIGGANYMYIESAIIEVTQKRNIVKTTIAGTDGTIKEFINNGDYDVKIMGYFATVDADIYPELETKAMNEYLTAPIALNVTNKFLNTYFNINSIAVESFEFKQVEGMRNVQYFTMYGVSDVPFEIIELSNA
jgi:hypothetical protein